MPRTPSSATPPSSTFTATPIQSAYAIGADPDQPLGGQHCLGYVEFGGKRLDPAVLEAAVPHLHRHPSLRAVMPTPEHLIDHKTEPPSLVVNDLRTAPDPEAQLEQIRQRLACFPVDRARGHTWALEASLLPDGTTTVHLVVSLIVTDLAGIGRMATDLARTIAEPDAPLPRYTFDDLRSSLRSPRLRPELTAPDPRREPLLAAPELPGSPATAPAITDRWQRSISVEEWERLGTAARRLSTPTTALVLGVFEECLRRWSSSSEFIVTVTGVDTRGTEDHVADRTLTFAHRSLPAPDLRTAAAEASRELRHRLLRGIEATEELREGLSAGTHSGMSPYVFTYAPRIPLFPAEVTDVLGEFRTARSSTPQVILDCQIIRFTEAEVTVSFDVRRGALEQTVAQQLFDSFIRSLETLAAAESEDLPLSAIAAIPPETQSARAAVNASPAVADGLLHAPFLRTAERTPTAPALLWDPAAHPGRPSGTLTYRELLAEVRELAGRIAAHAAPGSVIGVRLPKGPDQVLAVLAVLHAGCCYLPLGVDLPENRVSAIQQASGMTLLVDAGFLAADSPARAMHDPVAVEPHELAYIIYTSGSTGAPKGVAIAHHSAANTIADVNARHSIGPKDRTLAVSALDFDLSVYDIFGPLSVGGAVVLIGEESRRDAFSWADLIERHQVTIWNSVPSLAEMLCVAAERPLGLRRVLCSGDWIDLGLPGRLAETAPGAVLVAMGGATEASIWSNEFVVESPADLDPSWSSIPYGRPLSGQRYRVADAEGRDCPDHVAGELWIGGVGVAAGYHGAPELTAERFVEVDGERWYRTGDLGMWIPGPLLVFLGRRDTQVKVRGHRVECGEVEHALRQTPGVSDAVVIPIRNRSALGAVVIGESADTDHITDDLRERLPGYMVPSAIARTDRLRLTTNGKVDRRWAATLLENEPSTPGHATDGPISTEWLAVLGEGTAEADANFFSVGGDSLKATELCSRLRAHGYTVSVADLFAEPRFDDFAQRCRALQTAQPAESSLPAADAAETGAFPLTRLQQAYALGVDGLTGVVRTPPLFATVLATVDGSPIDRERLGAVATALAAELEVLRCHRLEDIQQTIAEPRPIPVRRVETDLEVALLDPQLDLEAAPVLQLLADDRADRVGVRLNYLPLDARALATVLTCLLDDLAGRPRRLEVRGDLAAFRAYARRDAAEGNGAAPADDQATELPAPVLPHALSSTEPVRPRGRSLLLTAEQTEALHARAHEQGATASAVLLHTFGQVLGRITGQPRMGITVPVSYRPEGAEGELLGNFTQLALCPAGSDVDLAEVHASIGRAAAGQGPGGRDIVQAGRAAYPVVFTSTIGLAAATALTTGTLRPTWSITGTPGVLIDCQVSTRDAGIEIRLDHPEGVLEAEVIDRILAGLAAELAPQTDIAAEHSQARRATAPEHSAPWRESLLLRARQLTEGREVRPGLEAVAEAWRAHTPLHAPVPVPEEHAQVLADCLTGRARVTTLLEHPDLSPQALLVSAPEFAPILAGLVEVLRDLPDDAVVLEIGAGAGLFRDAALSALRAVDPHQADRLTWQCVETDALLRDLAIDRGVAVSASADQPADLVVAAASLHRDPRLVAELERVTAQRCWIVEVPRPTVTALLSAALLDPSVLSAEGPLRPVPRWWELLEQAGWSPLIADASHPDAVILQARRAAAPVPRADSPAPSAPKRPAPAEPAPAATEDARELLMRAWSRHLADAGPLDDDADFFALGGDSLVATRVLAEVRQSGYPLRLVELFNHPRLGDLAALLAGGKSAGDPAIAAPATAREEGSDRHPLTEVQQAYLSGRAHDQLLGGVSAHCYFEFHASAFDPARFRGAVETVVHRHPGLRTLLTDGIGAIGPVPPVVTEHPDPRTATEAEMVDLAAHSALVVRWRWEAEGAATIGIGMDNAVLDGTSMLLVLSEIGRAYAGETLGLSPTVTFADHVATHPWVTGELPAAGPERERVLADRAYVDAVADRLPPAPPLTDRAALAAVETPTFARATAQVEAAIWERIGAATADRGLTRAAVVLAAYALELADWSGRSDLTVNVTRFDRDLAVPGIEQVVGDFTSLTPIGCRIEGSEDLWALAARVQADLAEATDHGTAGTLWVQRRLLQRSGDPVASMFPVVFTCGLGLAAEDMRLDDFGFGPLVHAASQAPQTVLDLQVSADPSGLRLSADHVVQLLDSSEVAERLQRIAARLSGLVPAVEEPSAHPELYRQVRQAWSEMLDLPENTTAVNFFTAGGDSLRATRCVRLLRERVHPDIDLRTLLINPDLDHFVAAVALLPEVSTGTFEEGTL